MVKTKAPKIAERDISRDIRIWLMSKNYFTIRNYLGPIFVNNGQRARNPNVGMPDLFVILPNGHLAAIETKNSLGGKLSDEQIAWRESLVANHVLYVLAKCLDDVISTFAAWGF